MLSAASSVHHQHIMQVNPPSATGAKAGDNSFASMLQAAQAGGSDVSGSGPASPSALSGILQIMQISPPAGGSPTDGVDSHIMKIDPNGGSTANPFPILPPAGGVSTQQLQAMLQNSRSTLSAASALQTFQIDPPALGDGITA